MPHEFFNSQYLFLSAETSGDYSGVRVYSYSPIILMATIMQQWGLQVSCEEVVGAIKPFPCASAGGPDGLRPQHLKDMVCSSAGGGVSRLLRALTAFINLVLKGKTAPFVCPSSLGLLSLPWRRLVEE